MLRNEMLVNQIWNGSSIEKLELQEKEMELDFNGTEKHLKGLLDSEVEKLKETKTEDHIINSLIDYLNNLVEEEYNRNYLKATYREWREQIEELIEDGEVASWDCGEGRVREDFTEYARLQREISFEDMLELEREY